jgi:hypothetical protein
MTRIYAGLPGGHPVKPIHRKEKHSGESITGAAGMAGI